MKTKNTHYKTQRENNNEGDILYITISIFLPSKSKTSVVGGQLRVCFGSSMGRKVGTTADKSGKFFMKK